MIQPLHPASRNYECTRTCKDKVANIWRESRNIILIEVGSIEKISSERHDGNDKRNHVATNRSNAKSQAFDSLIGNCRDKGAIWL